jgi:hypothetical protein
MAAARTRTSLTLTAAASLLAAAVLVSAPQQRTVGTGTAAAAVTLRNVAPAAGIPFVLRHHPTPEKHLIESVPGGVAAFDANGDGRIDLFFTNGAVSPTLEKGGEQDWNRLYRNDGGMRFTDVTKESGLAGRGYAMGAAAADYDNDGDVDLALGSIGGPVALLRNDGARGHWLTVSVEPFAPGATVTVVLPDGRRLVRDVQAGSSYLSSEDPRVHFGLGAATAIRAVTVAYPGGTVERVLRPPVDRALTVRRSGG